jgi:hypothetical protein
MASLVQRSNGLWRKLGRVAVLSAAVGTMVGGAAVLGTAAPAGAVVKTLYVSPYGSDAGGNPCTVKSNPCQTLKHANNIVGNGDTINLAPGTFVGNITINKDISIVGVLASGSLDATNTTIDGEGNPHGAFTMEVDGVHVIISNLVIDGGFNIVGGIYNEHGELDLTNVTLEDNEAVFGGGIYNDGLLSMTGGSISNNDGIFGAGLYNDGEAILKNVTFNQDNATAFDPGEGGAIFNDGELKLEGTNPIHNNTAFDGGGIEECSGAPLSTSAGTSITANAPNQIGTADPDSEC